MHNSQARPEVCRRSPGVRCGVRQLRENWLAKLENFVEAVVPTACRFRWGASIGAGEQKQALFRADQQQTFIHAY
jgi:hypothetical protein